MKWLALIIMASMASLSAMTSEEVLILIKKGEEPKAVEARLKTDDSGPRDIVQAYKRWYDIAYMVTLDSPSGPKPGLGMDNVYDANGYPVPRLPDPYTLKMFVDPTNQEYITDYLDWRKVAIRRMMLVANNLPDAAMQRGIITPDVLAYAPSRPTDQKAVGDYSKIEPETLGAPLMSEGKARELGIDNPKEVPRLPGEVSPSGVEVYWYWNHHCGFCTKMARTWFAFAREVNAAGYKAVSINTANIKTKADIQVASMELASIIEMWTVTWGEDVERSRNWLDWTDTANAFAVKGTPTTIFINRNGAKFPVIERLVGEQDSETLRATLAKVGGWSPNVWPPPTAKSEVLTGNDANTSNDTTPGTTPIGKNGP